MNEVEQKIEDMCTCTGNDQCLHYNEPEHVCKFRTGNCGQRRDNRKCVVDGHPKAYMRQIKDPFTFDKPMIDHLGF